MASDDVPYIELEIPARYKMKRALKGEDDSLKYSYEAWRVLCVDPDIGEVTTISNSASDDYKTERKILLRNLSGSSAFKSGAKKTEVESCE